MRLPSYTEVETILVAALVVIPIIIAILCSYLIPTACGLADLIWWCVSGIIFLMILVVEIYILLSGD